MKLMKDNILWDTILEYLVSGSNIPKRTKTTLSKDWFKAMKKFKQLMILMVEPMHHERSVPSSSSTTIPKRTKTTLSKDWFKAMKKQLISI